MKRIIQYGGLFLKIGQFKITWPNTPPSAHDADMKLEENNQGTVSSQCTKFLNLLLNSLNDCGQPQQVVDFVQCATYWLYLIQKTNQKNNKIIG